MAGSTVVILFPLFFIFSDTSPLTSEVDIDINIGFNSIPEKFPETAYINPFVKSRKSDPFTPDLTDQEAELRGQALTDDSLESEEEEYPTSEGEDLTDEEIEAMHFNRIASNSSSESSGVHRCRESNNNTSYSIIPGYNSQDEEQTARYLSVRAYLCKFGYLTSNQDEDMVEALREFQRFAMIPDTGVADEKTLALMKLPRCGDSDKRTPLSKRKKRWANSKRKWEKSKLQFYVAKFTKDMPRGLQRKEIARALKLWEKVIPVDFVEKRRYKRDVDIVLSFQYYYHRDDYSFDGTGGELAHAFLPEMGVIHFDDSEFWTSNENYGINLYSVSAHEIGHSLGLEHTSKRGALMSPFYDDFSSEKPINADDVVSIQNLYGSRGKMLQYDCPQIIKWDTAFTDTVSGLSYAFYGEQVWKFDEGGLMKQYPRLAINVFYGLPSLTIEASVAFKSGYVFLFAGTKYWKYNATTGFMADGYPKSIAKWGLDLDIKINDIIRWPRNNYVYFFTSNTYYRYNSAVGRMDEGYPEPLYLWQGVPTNFDSSMTSMDGSYTFFFLYHYYFPFNNRKAAVDTDQIQEIKYSFFLCEEYVMDNGEKARFLGDKMAEINSTRNTKNWERFKRLEIDLIPDDPSSAVSLTPYLPLLLLLLLLSR